MGMASDSKQIDLVLEGGGVRGFGLVGALSVLEAEGYAFRRIAGTSAGSIAASLLAAGYTTQEMEELMYSLDFGKFADEGMIDKLGVPGKSASVLFEKGIYEGRYIAELVTKLLATKGVATFGDLRIADADPNDIKSQYKLVIMATDVTRGRLIRLPWDYVDYGLDPDAQPIAEAVRASAAIPFYYEPARIGDSFVVDGGIISNFPIWIFEGAPHHHSKQHPTLGIKLSAKPEALAKNHHFNTSNTLTYSYSILRTILSAQDQIHLDDPCTLRRTMFVDSAEVKSTDFDIARAQKQLLYENGVKATTKFLKEWDFEAFLHACPSHH